MEHVAHKRKSDGRVQSVREHVDQVAGYAWEFGEKAGIKYLAKLAALLHDMGKERKVFWDYLKNVVTTGDQGMRGTVDHATAGAIYLWQKYHGGSQEEKITVEIVAMTVAYHHGGLGDFLDPECQSEFLNRIGKDLNELDYDEVQKNYFQACVREDELAKLFYEAVDEVKDILARISGVGMNEALTLALLTKYVYSCIIDADRLDTYFFMEDKKPLTYKKRDWDLLHRSLEEKMKSFQKESKSANAQVAKLRRAVSDECLAFAKWPEGIYRLTVPTGGGKTLSSLRYALEHARRYGKDHIIYIVPFLTIIDQNVKDVKEALGVDEQDRETVLEYHSNVVQHDETQEMRLASERFEAPIIFTTMVQFLNTFYGKGSKDMRKLHQLANSVLIFDEVQAVPLRCIHLFNAALNFLNGIGKSTVVLCTATQPNLQKGKHPLLSENSGEMLQNVTALFQQLSRTEIVNDCKPEGYSHEEMGEYIWGKGNLEGNALAIFNTKKSARKCYELLQKKNSELDEAERFQIYHLSTSMCAQHRLEVLAKIKEGLKANQKIICVSTQLIEAGVNISFRCVVRVIAGLDSIAQAAGRCNRNGETAEKKKVYIINERDENLDKLPEIKSGRDATVRILDEFKGAEAYFDNDLLSPKTMGIYFTYFYHGKDSLMDFPVEQTMTDISIVSLLKENKKCASAYRSRYGHSIDLELKHAHRTAAEHFHVISGGTTGVLVPYGEGKAMIEKLEGNCDFETMKSCLRSAQRFTVNLFQWEVDVLSKNKGIRLIRDGAVYVLEDRYYNQDFGVELEGGSMPFLTC